MSACDIYNYYSILGVNKNASDSTIKKAYRELAIKYHPDKTTFCRDEAIQIFTRLTQAYEILIDEQKRRNYDTWEKNKQETQNISALNPKINQIICGLIQQDFLDESEEENNMFNNYLNSSSNTRLWNNLYEENTSFHNFFPDTNKNNKSDQNSPQQQKSSNFDDQVNQMYEEMFNKKKKEKKNNCQQVHHLGFQRDNNKKNNIKYQDQLKNQKQLKKQKDMQSMILRYLNDSDESSDELENVKYYNKCKYQEDPTIFINQKDLLQNNNNTLYSQDYNQQRQQQQQNMVIDNQIKNNTNQCNNQIMKSSNDLEQSQSSESQKECDNYCQKETSIASFLKSDQEESSNSKQNNRNQYQQFKQETINLNQYTSKLSKIK